MFAIIGMVVVIGAVVGGFLMEKGNLLVLLQPAELVIIGGGAGGTLLVANPLPVVIKIFTGMLGVIGGSKYTKAYYLSTLRILLDLFNYARKAGMAKLGSGIEGPHKNDTLNEY